MASVSKQDLIKKIAEHTGKSAKESGEFLGAFVESVKESLSAGDEVRLIGFGVFSAKKTAARTATNPRTREKVDVPESVKVRFVAGKELAESVKDLKL